MGRLIDADKAIELMQFYHDDCAKTSEYTRLGFETAIGLAVIVTMTLPKILNSKTE